MTDSSSDFLFGGGSKSAKFETIGDAITGTIASTEVKQQTDLATGAPLTWDNGDPRLQLVVTLETTDRDDPDDDGRRSLYVKGSKKPGSQSLHDAVAQAVKAVGAKGIEPGGNLRVTFVGTEPSATRGFNDRKKYSAEYTAPDKAAASGDFLGTEQVNTTTGEVTPAAQAPAPAANGPTPEQIAAVKTAGLDPASVFGTNAS